MNNQKKTYETLTFAAFFYFGSMGNAQKPLFIFGISVFARFEKSNVRVVKCQIFKLWTCWCSRCIKSGMYSYLQAGKGIFGHFRRFISAEFMKIHEKINILQDFGHLRWRNILCNQDYRSSQHSRISPLSDKESAQGIFHNIDLVACRVAGRNWRSDPDRTSRILVCILWAIR